jgi:DNA-directed RNA polymerase specialized sigma24 family protein
MDAAGSEHHFRREIDAHRRAITVHCYRMLGSLQDAEDVAQESLTKAWRRMDQLARGGEGLAVQDRDEQLPGPSEVS